MPITANGTDARNGLPASGASARVAPVCITGMHRSGTSMVARLLQGAGLYLGRSQDMKQAAPDNPDGFWENVKFVEINDAILEHKQGGWDCPRDLPDNWRDEAAMLRLCARAIGVLDELEAQPAWGWKDPRNCLTLPFWRALLPELRTVICLRHPIEVATSLRYRNGCSQAYGLALWETYNRRALASAPAERRLITHYEAYFVDPRRELGRVLEFLSLEVSEETVAQCCAAISSSLRHHRSRAEELREENVPRETVELYLEMCREAAAKNETITNKKHEQEGETVVGKLNGNGNGWHHGATLEQKVKMNGSTYQPVELQRKLDEDVLLQHRIVARVGQQERIEPETELPRQPVEDSEHAPDIASDPAEVRRYTLEQRLFLTEHENESLQLQLGALRERLFRLSVGKEDAEAEALDLLDALDKQTGLLQQAQARIRKSEQAEKAADELWQVYEAEATQRNQHLETARRDNESLQRELLDVWQIVEEETAAQARRMQELSEEKAEVRQQLETVEQLAHQQIILLRRSITELANERDAARGEAGELQQQVAEQVRRVEMERTVQTELHAHVHALHAEIDTLRHGVEDQAALHSRLGALTEEKTAVEHHLHEARHTCAAQARQIEELRAAVETIAGQEQALRAMLLEAHDQLLRRDDELQQAILQNAQATQPAAPPVAAPAAEPAEASGNFVANKHMAYRQLIGCIRRVVHSTLPAEAVVVVVSKGDKDLLSLEGRQGWHFPQDETGAFPGYYPKTGAEVVEQLEALRQRGGSHLLFPSTAFWWLDYYTELKQHLEERYRLLWNDASCRIYQLAERQITPGRAPRGLAARMRPITRLFHWRAMRAKKLKEHD